MSLTTSGPISCREIRSWSSSSVTCSFSAMCALRRRKTDFSFSSIAVSTSLQSWSYNSNTINSSTLITAKSGGRVSWTFSETPTKTVGRAGQYLEKIQHVGWPTKLITTNDQKPELLSQLFYSRGTVQGHLWLSRLTAHKQMLVVVSIRNDSRSTLCLKKPDPCYIFK